MHSPMFEKLKLWLRISIFFYFSPSHRPRPESRYKNFETYLHQPNNVKTIPSKTTQTKKYNLNLSCFKMANYVDISPLTFQYV